MRIERREDRVAGFEGVDPGGWHSRVRLPPRDRHLQMQTTVVCGDHRIRKAGRDRDVGPHQALIEQPFRTDASTGLLVIGEMQLERSIEPGAFCNRRPQRQQRPGVRGEIRFRYGHTTSVHDRAVRPVLDDRPIRIVPPPKAGRHHVAMGIERDDRPIGETVADDEVRRAPHAGGLDDGARHLIRLDRETELLEKSPRALRMCRTIAGRIVAGHLHELGEKLRLARKFAIDERRYELGDAHDASASRSTASSTMRAAISASSAVMISWGEWLTPPFPQRTNSMAVSVRPSNIMASWPAPLGR